MTSDNIVYWAAFMLNTTVIIVDVLIIYCAIKTGEIWRHFVLQTIFLAILMDIGTYLTVLGHDVPSFIMGTDVSPDPLLTYFIVAVITIQWFTQLFVLLVLSVIHALAVFTPTQFRTFSSGNIKVINAIIMLAVLLLTVPHLTPWSGYYYSTEGYYWSWDFGKPYTYIYVRCNLVLQGVCAITVICVDVMIVYRLRKTRIRLTGSNTKVFTTASVSQSPSVQEARLSSEMQLAVNYILLSACFLVMTTFYNLKIDAFVSGFLAKLSYNINLAKWSIYILGNESIRRKLLSLLRCGEGNVSASTSHIHSHVNSQKLFHGTPSIKEFNDATRKL